MKKADKTNEIIRWIVLVPAVFVLWLATFLLCAWIEGWFYTPYLWMKFGLVFILLDVFVAPSFATFYLAKYIAPNHKKIAGVGAVVFCAILGVVFLYGLFHMAY